MKMEDDRKVVVLVISNNETQAELFRVHIHKQSIRFDSHFTEGIENHPDLSEDIRELNELWKAQKIGTDQIFQVMIHFMNKYADYLSNYYFKEYELDKNGHYIEPIVQDKSSLHYQYLKQSKQLKRISKKEFEKNIKSSEVAEYYVENYMKKGARFFKSDRVDSTGIKSTWFFMVVNERFKISFFTNVD